MYKQKRQGILPWPRTAAPSPSSAPEIRLFSSTFITEQNPEILVRTSKKYFHLLIEKPGQRETKSTNQAISIILYCNVS